jgi:FkbM family methyltransferase
MQVRSNLRKIKNYFVKSSAKPLEVEKSEQIFYIRYLQPGMTVFDIGANVGEISLLFSRFVGSEGSVHSFEASSETFKRLNSVCEILNQKQIFLNHKAVADKEGVLRLNVYDDEYSEWNSLANRPLENYGINIKPDHVEEVESITIDGYCSAMGIEHIDLLKVDVEGAEYQVLLGARKMLEQKRIACCVFEFGGTTFDMGNTANDLEDYLKGLGYNIRNIVQGDSIFPGRESAQKATFSVHVATFN